MLALEAHRESGDVINLRDLFTADDGVSRVASREVPSLHVDPADVRTLADPVAMENAVIKLYTAGWEQRGRNAPQVQFVIVLSGRMEVEVPDGTTAVVEPGNILLCRDVNSTSGHVTRFPVQSSMMAVKVDPAFDLDAWLGLSGSGSPDPHGG